LSVLISNALRKDLTSTDLKVQCLALTFLANIRSAEICQPLASDVLRLCDSISPAVMNRAEMAAVRVVQRANDLAETFKLAVKCLLKPGAHGIVISAINLAENII
jgi:vesicle coat complex subunit